MDIKILGFLGKIVVILCETKGIGFAIAKVFVEHGAQVAILGCDILILNARLKRKVLPLLILPLINGINF